MGIILALFKGDLKNIYEEPNKVKAYCDIKSVAMFLTMIKEKFTDDQFLTGENRICLYISPLLSFFVGFLHFLIYLMEKIFQKGNEKIVH